MRARDLREKAVKEALVRQLRSSGISLEEVRDWLWDDFGKRVRGGWDRVEREIVSSREISPQDLAVFMIDSGVMPDEGAWDVYPARLRGPREGEDDSEGDEGR